MAEAKTKLGRMLRNMRKQEGLSLRKYAEKIDISHAYLDKLERGLDVRTGKEITPTIDVLLKIARNLGIDETEFLYQCGYLVRKCAVREGAPGTELDVCERLSDLLEQISVAQHVVAKAKTLTNKQVTDLAKKLSAIVNAL